MSGYGYMFNESEIPQSVRNGLEMFGKINFGSEIHYIIEKDDDGEICLFSTSPNLAKTNLKTVSEIIETNGNQLKLRDFMNTLNFIEDPEKYKDMPVDEITEDLDSDFLREYAKTNERTKARLISFTDKDIPLYIKDRILKTCFDNNKMSFEGNIEGNNYIYIFKDEFYNDSVAVFNDNKEIPTVYKLVSEVMRQLKDERTNPENFKNKFVMGDIQGTLSFFKKMDKLTGLSVPEIEQKIDTEYLQEGTVHSVITAYANFDQKFIDKCHPNNKGIGKVLGYRFDGEMENTECDKFSIKGHLYNIRFPKEEEYTKIFRMDEPVYIQWDGGYYMDTHSEYINETIVMDLSVTPTPKYEVVSFKKEEPVFEKDDILEERA